jgi:hypothetical protein
MLKQEIGWFDKNENHVGVLVTKLAVEVNYSLNNIFIQSNKKKTIFSQSFKQNALIFIFYKFIFISILMLVHSLSLMQVNALELIRNFKNFGSIEPNFISYSFHSHY